MAAFDEGMRLFQVTRSSSRSPLPDVGGGSGWLLPSKMGGRFSSTCWFYGRDVYSVLSPKVPFGLIETDVGGTPDEHWSSPDALKACMGSKAWDMPEGTVDSVLWNAMIVGLLRTTISGVVWYQGENNAGDPRRYNCSFPAMIEDWRAKWHTHTDGATARDLPFGWAQLNSCGTGAADYTNRIFNPPHPPADCGDGCAPACSSACLGRLHEWGDYGNGFTGIRFAQAQALLRVRNTFMAVIIDTPVASGSIHSPFKQPVGRRLARGGLAVAYGQKQYHAVAPVVEGVALRGGTVEVTVGGLGHSKQLVVNIGARGFEVLGNCSAGPSLCWMSSPIAAASADTVTLTRLPSSPQAVRFLWYIDAVGVHPFQAPIYARAPTLPGAPSCKYDGGDLLPLGPFVLPL